MEKLTWVFRGKIDLIFPWGNQIKKNELSPNSTRLTRACTSPGQMSKRPRYAAGEFFGRMTYIHIHYITHLLRVIVTPTFFQALDRKTTQLSQKQISGLAVHLIFQRLSPFNCCLSVVLQLDKGDYPENCVLSQ